MARPGIALLVDGDNVPPSILAGLVTRLERDGTVTERRIWRNWRSTRDSKEWDATSKELAFERVDRYKTRAEGKNASDIAVAIGAMDLFVAGTRDFCIVSGDTDFAPLIERLRRGGSKVTIVGHHPDPGLLEQLADRYWHVQEFGAPGKASKSPGRTKGGGKNAATKAQASGKAETARGGPRAGKAPQPAKTAATGKVSKDKAGAPGQSAAGPVKERELSSFLADVYDTCVEEGQADDDGWISIDRLGKTAHAKRRGFSPRDFGLPARTSLNEMFRHQKKLFEVHAQTAKGGKRRSYRVRRR